MSSFGSSVSRRRKNTTKSTFGSRKLSTSRPSSHGKINSNNNKRVSGGRKKKAITLLKKETHQVLKRRQNLEKEVLVPYGIVK